MRTSFTVLALCSDMLLFSAVIIGGNTCWGLLRMSYYFWTTHLGVELASCVLLIAASLLSLPVCWVVLLALQRPSIKIVPFYVTLMVLLSSSLLLTAMGLTSLSGMTRSVNSPRLNESMTHAMTYGSMDPMVYTSFSAMQTELKCCGVRSYKDWYAIRTTLPPSCCGLGFQSKRNFTKCSVPLYTRGCSQAAKTELSNFFNALSVYSSGGILIMAITLFITAYMFVTQKDDNMSKSTSPAPLVPCVPSTLSFTFPAPFMRATAPVHQV